MVILIFCVFNVFIVVKFSFDVSFVMIVDRVELSFMVLNFIEIFYYLRLDFDWKFSV